MSDTGDPKPNILFIHVDEMRFPMHFPDGIEDAGQWLETFMPKVHDHLWKTGVKFSNYHAAGCACSPSRGAFVTGLYGQQTGMLTTRANPGDPTSNRSPQAELSNEFPTYGKLLREGGYATPYIGKFHLINTPEEDGLGNQVYLEDYGFKGYSLPDPEGLPGQGIGHMQYPDQLDDEDIADQAVAWLQKHDNQKDPFCLTVGFVNPHDKQFFWGGTEGARWEMEYDKVKRRKLDPNEPFDPNDPYFSYKELAGYEDVEESAPQYPENYIPDNWESEDALKDKPSLQRAAKLAFGYLTGGISEIEGDENFSPVLTGFGQVTKSGETMSTYKIDAPYSYWRRSMQMYITAMHNVDEHIGHLLDNIPESVAENLVIVFTADHAGSHGMQGKAQTAYRESYNIPLIVSGYGKAKAFISEPGTVRRQLASSIDLAPMLVSLGHGGKMDWIKEPAYDKKYDTRALYGDGKREIC